VASLNLLVTCNPQEGWYEGTPTTKSYTPPCIRTPPPPHQPPPPSISRHLLTPWPSGLPRLWFQPLCSCFIARNGNSVPQNQRIMLPKPTQKNKLGLHHIRFFRFCAGTLWTLLEVHEKGLHD